MSTMQIRPTNGTCTVVAASEMYHRHGQNQGRQCDICGSVWTVQRDANDNFHVWRNGQAEDNAILDWTGNNVAIECCNKAKP